ncbi:hypothetical protein OQA88_1665 [Cercophora sp. LCS_1]
MPGSEPTPSKAKAKAKASGNRRGEGVDDNVDENTPLLLADGGDGNLSEETTVTGQSSENGEPDPDPDDKPLPVFQILVLCYARWVEPVAFFSIFPYINKMAEQNGHLAKTDAGFYSGLIESLFSLTQMFVMILWGRASDRFGRRPVLITSLLGVSCATGLFGMATTLWQMMLFRCMAGVFAGTIVTIRTMISEHSTSKTQARAFSWFAFAGNLGILVGPLIGGALAEPAHQFPKIFGHIQFFIDYPYALPSMVVGAIGMTAVVSTALFAEETLVRETPTFDEEGSPVIKPPPLTTWELIKSPGVPIVLYTYGHVMLLAYSYTAISPLFWYTKIDLGGLGFEPNQIAIFLGVAGFSQAIWMLVVFPKLHGYIGTNGIMRSCGYFYPVFFFICPCMNALMRMNHPMAVWISMPMLQSLGSGVSMSFTAIQLALNDVSPSPVVLGTLNAVALSLITGVRAVSPAAFSSLFAIGARTQWLSGYAIWVLMMAMGAGFTVACRYLPDYAELKRQRESKGRAESGEGYSDAERNIFAAASTTWGEAQAE